MAGITVGDLVVFYAAPQWVDNPSDPNGGQLTDYVYATIKASGDDKEYQFSWPADKGAPGLQQLEQWQGQAQKVMVLWSGVRAMPFYMDPAAKNDDGSAKRYPTPGKKLQIGKVSAEIGTMLTFAAFDLQPAGSLDVAEMATKAHAAYLKQQAESRKRSTGKRIEQAKKRAEQRQAEAKAKLKKSA